jgi:hypothetical protein
LKLSHLEFEELDHILSGSLLSLKGSREHKHRLKFGGKGVKVVDDVLWDVDGFHQNPLERVWIFTFG